MLFLELNDHLSRFIKYYESLVNTKEISSFYKLPVLRKIYCYCQRPIISTFYSAKKLIMRNFPFLLIWTCISRKVVSVINSYFHRNLFLLNILKDLLNLHYKGQYETKINNFFSLMVTTWYIPMFVTWKFP